MSDERKGKELLKHLKHMFKCYEYNFINNNIKPPKEGIEAYQQIYQLIQQKPEIDDMEKYVEEKARELFYRQEYYTQEQLQKFITQIISDVKGR